MIKQIKRSNLKLPLPLLYFQGGGYDGCFWEPNVAIFSKVGGRVVPVEDTQQLISGYRGKDVLRAAKSGLLQVTRMAYSYEGKWLKNEADWRWFCKEIGEGYVRTAARHVVDLLGQYCKPYGSSRCYDIPCDDCGCACSPNEIFHWSYRGNGGIGVNMIGLLCDDCLGERNDKYVRESWSWVTEAERKAAWEKSMFDNPGATPEWEVVRDAEELPLHAEYVYEKEYL